MRRTRQARARRRGGARRAAFAVAPLGLVVLLASLPAKQAETKPVVESISSKPRILYNAASATAPPLPTHALYLTIEPGDTLKSLFQAGGLAASEAHQLALAFGKWADLRRLRPGDLVRLLRSTQGEVREVQLKISGWGNINAVRDASGRFDVQAHQPPERRVEVIVSGPVDRSLWVAIERAGETPQLVPELADIFQWDVDFFQIQRGDWFSAVVERRYVGDDHVGYGPIQAAKFHHQGETHEAFRYQASDGTAGYYTRTGTPVRKQFLKAPLKFTRITSGFSHRRYHPLLRRFRPHYGIDYGAPIGTPVLATADGVVAFAGYDSGEGKHIRIKHNARMETAYLHLSRFAKDLKRGTRVQQGDVIGYVGMTGLTTGPHLDYRVTERGKPLNPLQLRSITPDPLRGESLRRFKLAVRNHLPKLPSGDTLLAEGTEAASPALF